MLHALEAEADALEEEVFSSRTDQADVERIYELRHELLLLRRAAQPLQEVCNRIMRYDVPLIDHAMNDYFRDIQDHVIRVVEGIDNLRDLLTAALEANLLLVSLAQNDVTKKLTGWAAILSIPLAIASIYGMNFKWMPELEHAIRLSGRDGGHHRAVRILVLPVQARGLALIRARAAGYDPRISRVRKSTRPRTRNELRNVCPHDSQAQ